MPGFAADAEEYLNECNRAYRSILKALALALGLDRDYFEQYHKKGGESTFSLNHSSSGSIDMFKNGRFGAHTVSELRVNAWQNFLLSILNLLGTRFA